jgi:hypothetical protein
LGLDKKKTLNGSFLFLCFDGYFPSSAFRSVDRLWDFIRISGVYFLIDGSNSSVLKFIESMNGTGKRFADVPFSILMSLF